jgi:hypothetical protein
MIHILAYILLHCLGEMDVGFWVFKFNKISNPFMVYLPSLAHIIQATNGRVTGQQWTRNDVGGNIANLITSSIVDFAWRFWKKSTKELEQHPSHRTHSLRRLTPSNIPHTEHTVCAAAPRTSTLLQHYDNTPHRCKQQSYAPEDG